MASSIISQLGYGSGLDTAALVSQLTAAAKAPKAAQIAAREATNTAQISSLASISNGIDSFSSSLKTLISGGSLMTQPTASSENVAVKALPGAKLGGLSAQLEVKKLAKAQSLASGLAPAATATVGRGVLTLTVGTSETPITVSASNASLAGVANAINAAGTGVTASVVKDAGQARLVLKGETGAAKAFTLTAAADPSSDPATPDVALASLAYPPDNGVGMTRQQEAIDAELVLDGLTINRPTNSLTDVIPGVQLTLKTAEAGKIVTVGAERPTASLTAAVEDFVSVYNDMKSLIDAATKVADADGKNAGPLRGDRSLRDMQRRLSQLTSTRLVADGTGPKTLAEIGVVTNRNGTLTVDSARLSASIAADPDGVEAMFNPAQRVDNPLVTLTGAAKPGSYALSDIVPASGATPASGKIDGVAATAAGNRLSAAAGSAAAGLSFEASGPVASAKVTVDLGLGGALSAIRDAFRAGDGPLAALSSRLSADTKRIGTDRTSMEARSAAYNAQLTRDFTAMEKRVSAFKATQSYLEQQIKVWANSDN